MQNFILGLLISLAIVIPIGIIVIALRVRCELGELADNSHNPMIEPLEIWQPNSGKEVTREIINPLKEWRILEEENATLTLEYISLDGEAVGIVKGMKPFQARNLGRNLITVANEIDDATPFNRG